jgi:hypothetical protein
LGLLSKPAENLKIFEVRDQKSAFFFLTKHHMGALNTENYYGTGEMCTEKKKKGMKQAGKLDS